MDHSTSMSTHLEHHLIINKVVVSGATAYEVTVLPQTDPTFSTFLARCTYSTRQALGSDITLNPASTE